MKRSLTPFILAGLVLGLAAGFAAHAALAPDGRAALAAGLSTVTGLFLRLIKMIIAPLVLATLIGGIAKMDNAASLGRIGLRTMGWFIGASLVSLSLGLVLVTVLQPGRGANLVVAVAAGPSPVEAFSMNGFLDHLVPTSIVAAMAQNEVLQIVLFSVLAGVGLLSMGSAALPLLDAVDALATLMLRLTGYVMWLSPLAVFAAVAAAIAVEGPGIVLVYGRFLGGFYLGIALLWLLLFAAGAAMAGRRILGLPAVLRAPLMLAFSTASSEAALAPTLAALERFGVRPRVAGFVLPLGYSFNLDGTMMYCTFAAIFIAQAYDVPLSLWQQLSMLLTLMVTSKGIAGVPRAAIVVLAATLPRFGIPEAGLLALLGIDHFVDMGRTATNVVGNSIAAVVVDRAERRAEQASAETPPLEAAAIPWNSLSTPSQM
ncbi:dicarboxylate/amino acid:cation symporter [Sphingomonas quercus]|uniref:Dicarboxylate/amino acid:cation symporter n=1 Tax=Sphingomonas quercus TaxID=2842451 RepID=A0ABS6BJ71_9SPHN|nr:dicarboxylate/amino acid:cation symporter [Sphingomonas quercus]MBU3078229.1 dicarboxylate/amino acid:cation symporter [Sphingomonas quercus]